MDVNTIDRFWSHVDKSNDCWNWRLYTGSHGYGYFTLFGKKLSAHRTAYMLTKGEIPNGLHIDHLCRNRKCVNPDHLEAVTIAENNRRIPAFVNYWKKRDYCSKGHPFVDDNLLIRKCDGDARRCKQCNRDYQRKYWHTKTKLKEV